MTGPIARASAAPPPRRGRRPRGRGSSEHPGDPGNPPAPRSNASAALHRSDDAATSQTMDQIDGHH